MNTKERIEILSKLRLILNNISEEKEWFDSELGINRDDYERLVYSVLVAKVQNQWFTKESVLEAFKGVSSWLTVSQLSDWQGAYEFDINSPKKVAVIMAGNIPMVGFHDMISVFLSGHNVVCKLSSDDKVLLPAIIEVLSVFNPKVKEIIEFTENRLPKFDAVIATGSDNSAMYFETYFGKYPHIIRKNRTSIGIINGSETKEQLSVLGKDIFTYFGLGCRNVSKILIPKDFLIDRFFEAIVDYGEVVNHNKYANNYDYNKAVYLMNLDQILDNNFILLKEDKSLHSPLGVLFYERYDSQEELNNYLELNKNELQAIVGENYIPFGVAQCPSLNDYADGVDTMKFLETL
jgi:hypothetical protein